MQAMRIERCETNGASAASSIQYSVGERQRVWYTRTLKGRSSQTHAVSVHTNNALHIFNERGGSEEEEATEAVTQQAHCTPALRMLY
jgi:hypothetical protein